VAGLEGSADLQKKLIALQNGTANERILRLLGNEVVSRAKQNVAQKTRNLHRTIRVDEVDERTQTVRVVAGSTNGKVGYAQYVEFGTKPHVIVPKPGRKGRNGRPAALAWGGARRLSGNLRSGSRPTNFAYRVNHPGTRPRPYLVPAAQETLRAVRLAPELVKVWNDAS
jgi:hypothetical protein